MTQQFHYWANMLSCSVVLTLCDPHGVWPTRILCAWNFPGNNTGVNYHFLLQRIFLTQGPNPHLLYLLHWQADSLALCHVYPEKTVIEKDLYPSFHCSTVYNSQDMEAT